jgi:hypothetical protein
MSEKYGKIPLQIWLSVTTECPVWAPGNAIDLAHVFAKSIFLNPSAMAVLNDWSANIGVSPNPGCSSEAVLVSQNCLTLC